MFGLPADNLNNRKTPPLPLRRNQITKTDEGINPPFLPFLLPPPSPPLISSTAREAIGWAGGRLRLVSPFAAFLPLLLMASIFTLLLLLLLLSLLRVGASSFYLYRLSCTILAAAVLMLSRHIYVSIIHSPGTTLPLLSVLRYFLSVPPNSRLFRHVYTLLSSSRICACS